MITRSAKPITPSSGPGLYSTIISGFLENAVEYVPQEEYSPLRQVGFFASGIPCLRVLYSGRDLALEWIFLSATSNMCSASLSNLGSCFAGVISTRLKDE